MSEEASYYGLSRLQSGDRLADDDYKYTDADREIMSRLLALGAELHVHDGAAASVVDPDTALSYTLDTTSGSLPAATTIRYRYTWVDPMGFESAASPILSVTTPNSVAEPGAPTLSSAATGGTLLTGNYFYVLTAWTSVNTQETKPGTRAYVTLGRDVSTGEITLTLPSLPANADGFNIYRRGPGSPQFYFLGSVDMTVATPPTEYVDDGSTAVDVTRVIPRFNTTSSGNSIDLALPGATPTVPDGYTWKIYREFNDGDWEVSSLHWVVEETSEGSGIITPEYTDTGVQTTTGMPPSTSQVVGSPSQVDLEDASEVQGYLPPGRNVVPFQLTFYKSGTIDGQSDGEVMWVCEFEQAEIIHCRASMGRDGEPAAEVIVDVNKYDNGATPTLETIYSTQANRPRVQAGELIGDETVPDVVSLVRGDGLCIDVDQGDGHATPTAEDLTVNVLMLVRSESATASHSWAA